MKRFRLISFIFCFSIINTGNAQTWEIQDSGINNNLNDVYFIDEFHGWAVGDSATIIATNDGGGNWVSQNSPIDNVRLIEIEFVNENSGYIVGYEGTILSTTNGGNVWLENESGVDYLLFDLSFVNADTGWVVGGDFLQTRRWGVILHTVDGGETWEKQLETYSQDIFSSKLFAAVEFADQDNGWAFAGNYVDNFSLTYVYRTNNGGEEWDEVGVADTPLFEMSVTNSDTIWGGAFAFAKSNDRGVTWTYIWSLGVWDIQAISGRQAWVLGNSLIFTEDGMETWTEIAYDTTTTLRLRSIADIGEDNLWAVGNSGVIVHYSREGVSIDQTIDQTPEMFELEQNYPNPFNSTTTIGFSVISEEEVNLSIYDVNGREVINLLSRRFEQGRYEVIWDGKDGINMKIVPSGIYLCSLQYGGFTETRKMALIR